MNEESRQCPYHNLRSPKCSLYPDYSQVFSRERDNPCSKIEVVFYSYPIYCHYCMYIFTSTDFSYLFMLATCAVVHLLSSPRRYNVQLYNYWNPGREPGTGNPRNPGNPGTPGTPLEPVVIVAAQSRISRIRAFFSKFVA